MSYMHSAKATAARNCPFSLLLAEQAGHPIDLDRNPGMSDLMKATSEDDLKALAEYLAGR